MRINSNTTTIALTLISSLLAVNGRSQNDQGAKAGPFDAFAEFSTIQGGTSQVWTYEEFDGAKFSPLTFSVGGNPFSGFQPAWTAVGKDLPLLFRDRNIADGLVFHPGIPAAGPQPSRHDVVLSWVALKSGSYSINGFVRGDSRFGIVGNGFQLAVYREQDALLLLDIGFDDKTNHTIAVAHIHVNAGEKVRFRVYDKGNNESDPGVFNFTVAPVPDILRQPQDVEVKLGATATFFVQATGMGALRYQWRFNAARIIGGTSTNLVLTDITALDEGDYTVEVTDDNGSAVSVPAHLTLFRDSDGDGLSDSFEQGVGRYEIIEGSFTWHQAKEDAERRGGHLATITSQAELDYLISVFGNALLSKWLGGTDELVEGQWKWVTGEPWSFTKWHSLQPDNSSGQQHYLWFHTDFGLTWDDIHEDFPLGYVFERGFFTDPNNRDTDGDGFNDGVEFEAGSIPTDPNSRPLPRITTQPQGTNVIVGRSFALTVAADGFGSLDFQWRLDGKPISGATSATLTMSNAQHADAGGYDVVLRNGAGSVTSAAAIVNVTPVLELERLNNGFVIVQLLDERALAWRVEGSADLKTWQSLGAMSFTNGLGVFVDATSVGKPMRFYRVLAP